MTCSDSRLSIFVVRIWGKAGFILFRFGEFDCFLPLG
jgi:hypothetical protein